MKKRFRLYYWLFGRLYKATDSDCVGITSRYDKQLCFDSLSDAEQVAQNFSNTNNVETVVVDYGAEIRGEDGRGGYVYYDRIVSLFLPIKTN
jgi:hypothetical protein